MEWLKRIRFWQLMVGTGFALLLIGLVMVFLPPGVGKSAPFLIEFFEARVESSEMGLAMIVLGLSCFLIARKDLADLRTTRGIQEELGKTSTLAAKLVAERVSRTFKGLPTQPASLQTLPDLDLAGARSDLKNLQNGAAAHQKMSLTLDQAEQGLEILEALEREGYSI